MPPLAEMTGEKETALCRIIGRNLKEVEFDGESRKVNIRFDVLLLSGEDVKSAVTDLVLKIIENDPPAYPDAVKALEDTLKDMGEFPNTIQEYVKANIPSPPTPPEELERRAQVPTPLVLQLSNLLFLLTLPLPFLLLLRWRPSWPGWSRRRQRGSG
jgi:hypothetical protein